MKHLLEVKALHDVPKGKEKVLVWWIAIWYNLFYLILFGSWYLYSEWIAIANPKANGEPFEQGGMMMGLIPAFLTLGLAKIFIYDPLTKRILKNNVTHP